MFRRIIGYIKYDYPYLFALFFSIVALFQFKSFSDDVLGEPKRQFYYQNADNTLSTANASWNPRYTDDKVIRFLRRMVSQCYTIDYQTALKIESGDADNDYVECINRHFAPVASDSLFRVYPTDELIMAITESGGYSTAIVPYPPLVILRNKPDDSLVWVVEVPLMVTIQSVSSDQTTSLVAHYTVIPDSRVNNPSSLLIERVVFR